MKIRHIFLLLTVFVLVFLSFIAGLADPAKPSAMIPKGGPGSNNTVSVRPAGNRPTGGTKQREIPQETEGAEKKGTEGYQSRAGSWTLSGETSCTTGKKYTWKVSGDAAGHYEFLMGVLDGSYQNSNIADVQYDIYGESRTVSYTFWFPGSYVLFVDIFSEDNKYLDTKYLRIDVKDGGENEVTRMIRRVAAENKTDDEFQTVLNLHDWVIDHCSYDYSYTWYSADSVFLLNKGVCNSYARAFALLLKEAGIACRRVGGYAFGDPNAGHAWNAVRINGKWYLFDLTWDDTGDTADEMRRHLYFAVPDKDVFSLEHTAEKYVGGKVTCNSLEDNYFIHTNSWAEYTGDMPAQYRQLVDMGLHRFWLYLPAGMDDGYTNRLFCTIAVWQLDRTPVPDSNGHVYDVDFDISGSCIAYQHRHRGTITLPEKLQEVSPEAFSGIPATRVVIQDGCKSLAAGAFEGMDLWEVRIPDTVETVILDAFAQDRPSWILIIAPENSAAHQFAEDNEDKGFYWLPE